MMRLKDTVEDIKYNAMKEADAGYRRGYHHGYIQALEDTSLKKEIEKNYSEIKKWRVGKSPYKPTSEVELPPRAK